MTEDKKDMNLEALVSKLQTEGVDKANAKAEEIIAKAEADAEKILEKAKATGEKEREKASKDADKFKQNAISSIEIAARDQILALQTKIKELFDRAFKQEIAGEIDDSLLTKLIVKLVDEWSAGKEVKIELSKEDTGNLLKQVQAAVKNNFKDTVEIKHNRNISSGFRISLKGSEVNYDFTPETIAEALKVHLNPRLAELVKVKESNK